MKNRLIELLENNPTLDGMDGTSADFVECADYLMRNGVIAPSVFVGQMVYHYSPDLHGVFPYFVENLNIGFLDKGRNYWTYEANCHDEETDELLDEIDFDLDDIGKTVFITREEAEQALKECGGV